MRKPHTGKPDPRRCSVEANLDACVRSLFGRCPDLIGFSLHDPAEASGDFDPSVRASGELIIEMGFSTVVSGGDREEVFDLISTELCDLLAEQPEALDLMRGRTFARTLH